MQAERAERAQAAQQAKTQRLLAELEGQLGKLGRCTFADFRLDIDDPQQRQSLAQARAICESYAAAPAGWLYLVGSYGVGKSHLAAAIAREATERGQRVAYASTPRLLAYLAQGFADRSTEDRFLALVEAEVVVLDDIGAEHPNRWTEAQLFDLLNQRYLNESPTVCTSNIHPDALPGRIASRIAGLAEIVTIDAPDYRRR